ncbi:MAG TPA: hypothetical protein VFQ38_20155 [Longimicrobiales bacterium]|nr:hypothetical protein [Longimicrobiales bacterium]
MKRASILLLSLLLAGCGSDKASGPTGTDPGGDTGPGTGPGPGTDPGSNPGTSQPRFTPGTYGFRLTVFPGANGNTSSSYVTKVVLAFPVRDSLTLQLTQFGLPFNTQSFGGAWNGDAYPIRMRRSDTAGTVTALVRPPAAGDTSGLPRCEAQYSGEEGSALCSFTTP